MYPLSHLTEHCNTPVFNESIGENNNEYNIKYHCYADDTRVYVTFKPCDKSDHISFLHFPDKPSREYTNKGEHVFSVAAPALWNRLSADIRNAPSLEFLKIVLKTHPFKVALIDK